MKKSTLIAIALSWLVIGCSSPEKKAKKLIEEHLSKTMNDFKSYEPVEYSKLDSTFTAYEREYTIVADTTVDGVDDNRSSIERQKEADAKEDLKEKNFKPQFIGFHMNHQFRGKNSFGAMVISDYNFQFDKDLTNIIAVTDRVAATEEMNKRLEESQRELERLKSLH